MRVLTVGVFDVFHIGHLNYLEIASSFGDFLIVCICTDAMVRLYGRTPIFTYEERARIVRSLSMVDVVVPHDDRAEVRHISECMQVDLVVLSDEFIGKLTHTGHLPVVYVPYYRGVSSTEIKRRLR